jgi:hypothetical protein
MQELKSIVTVIILAHCTVSDWDLSTLHKVTSCYHIHSSNYVPDKKWNEINTAIT